MIESITNGDCAPVAAGEADELASNAISYGGGAGRLRLWLRDGMLYRRVGLPSRQSPALAVDEQVSCNAGVVSCRSG